MSVMEVTTRITPIWLRRKSKEELVLIIWANLDRIDIFATNGVGMLQELRKQHFEEAAKVAEECAGEMNPDKAIGAAIVADVIRAAAGRRL